MAATFTTLKAQGLAPINTGLPYKNSVYRYDQVKFNVYRKSNLFFRQNMAASFFKYKLYNPKLEINEKIGAVGYTATTEIGASLLNFASISTFVNLGHKAAKEDKFIRFDNINLGTKMDVYLQNPIVNVILTVGGVYRMTTFEVDRNYQRLHGLGTLFGVGLHKMLSRSTSIVLNYEYEKSNLNQTFGSKKIVDRIKSKGENIGLGLIILF